MENVSSIDILSRKSGILAENPTLPQISVKWWYIEITSTFSQVVISYHQTQIWYDSKVVLSCQNQRSKHLNFQYIYLISYKIAKKGKPSKTDLPSWKTISQVF